MTNSADATTQQESTENRSTTPSNPAFRERISQGWAPHTEVLPAERSAAAWARARRDRVSAQYPGVRVIVPAGVLKQRSNDTDYPFRAHSAFAHLTGWGADAEPGAVLVLEPTRDGHEAIVYFRERAGRDSDEFYANPEIGEFWIGPRPSLEHVAADLGVETRHLDEFGVAPGAAPVALVREADPGLTSRVDAARLVAPTDDDGSRDARLARDVSELRLVKDAFEIDEMRAAVAATARGFEDIIRELGTASAHPRGERVVEGAFHGRARLEGNEVGYETIAASGAHACILHWTRNDGPVRNGDLLLVDAGVELDSLYTADITRTLPVSGTFTAQQRLVYETVREAADAAFAIVRPGVTFRTIHETAMTVIARRTAEWGLLGVSADEALAPEGQHHRRYMVHGTSHHLGLDVHDCAAARRDLYLDGVLEEGMVFTIEPGLYFQPDDLTVPAELRGIGVRIEDDVLVTASGVENLSAGIPRTADEVESWMRAVRQGGSDAPQARG
ncbi:aminopeptidase P family protein [Pseudoclavibacter chungangensis]|uniref:Xaa-Pro aminopeptidase n=1 Tax=Pseudoclavibacter chungangensis TaxID=587635 RepID=A0A7J5BPQ2_9MICO|nr:aminopeptidase P family protein [Pseudoclavibacter chungangensis]KAB1655113.1 aminopeptidase P family protein [Pseudoclavibacter chungangensis]NYJ66115.1 Xaa-Pro aminopeptidase [Pseudoclavibacter chungangensis]